MRFSIINTLPVKKTDCDVSGFQNNGVIDSSRPEILLTVAYWLIKSQLILNSKQYNIY